MKRVHKVSVFTALSTLVLAGSAYGQGDFYIRAQHSNGTFSGFHEILTQPKDGYYEAQYCDRTFWVSSNTVIWTEEQVTAGQTLILEENLGTTRKVVCSDSTAFASLEDLGLKKREVERIRSKNAPLDMKSSRIRTISEAFKQFK
ncbi:MAG: hypothetical protein ABJL55_18795 [Roseibium sp.]